MRDGIVFPAAFDDRHATLSFTLRDTELQTAAGLKQFQRDKALLSGDLPGICLLTYTDLTEEIDLPPRLDPDPNDEKYGHLHCCTDRPRDQPQMERMAKLATRLCDMVRH